MEEEGYRQFATLEEEHWWFRARRRLFLHLLDRLVPAGAQWRVLDLGCGAGNLLQRLGRYGLAVGLEPSAVLAPLARERTGLPVVRGSGLQLPLADASVDLACLFDTLEHIPEEAQALDEVRRVLRPGGLVFVSVPAYEFLWTNNDRVAHHCRRYTRGRLRRSLQAAKLEPVRLSYFNTLLFPGILAVLLLQKARERWIGLPRADATNLTLPVPGAFAEILFRILASERHWLARRSLPTGHSLLAVARRPRGAGEAEPAAGGSRRREIPAR